MPLFDEMIIGDFIIQRRESPTGEVLCWQTVPVIRVSGGQDEVRAFGSQFAAKVSAGYVPKIQILAEVDKVDGFKIEKVLKEGTTVPQYRVQDMDCPPGGVEFSFFPTLAAARESVGWSGPKIDAAFLTKPRSAYPNNQQGYRHDNKK